jgi:hypothetical protein
VRRNAGLTQVELAARAGVTHSVSARTSPATLQPTLPESLVEAARFDLTIGLRGRHLRLRRRAHHASYGDRGSYRQRLVLTLRSRVPPFLRWFVNLAEQYRSAECHIN